MHKLVVGLGFGDESKGATVDWLCATTRVHSVIRFNGGPQAAHNVVQPDGRHHTFSQWGSGTFHGVPTHLSEYMLVNPFNLVPEAEHLQSIGISDPWELLTIDENALLITPYHQAANRARENKRAENRHGSTGQGVGEARAYALKYPGDAPRMADILTPNRLAQKLRLLHRRLDSTVQLPATSSASALVKQYRQMYDDGLLTVVSSSWINGLLDAGDCIFEGAQGVLLDELYGFNPHTTWTKTTQVNARALLNGRRAEVYGLTRAYHTRHGAGPFPTEERAVTSDMVDEPHNGTGKYQGAWRVGALDLSLLKYAIYVNGPIDKLIVSHVDQVADGPWFYAGYNEQVGSQIVPRVLRDSLLPVPSTLQESEELCQIIKRWRPAPYVPISIDQSPEALLEEALRDVVGITPYAYAYGPTSRDRHVVGDRITA